MTKLTPCSAYKSEQYANGATILSVYPFIHLLYSEHLKDSNLSTICFVHGLLVILIFKVSSVCPLEYMRECGQKVPGNYPSPLKAVYSFSKVFQGTCREHSINPPPPLEYAPSKGSAF